MHHTSSNLLNWSYGVTNKVLYEITQCTSLEDFQQRQQLKWIVQVKRREDIVIIKRLNLRPNHY